jgi:NAD(P)-dependent dehydrogenase (short-subunit alcohol dehydrogenase family)
MDRKICLITGANSGIGKEAAILIAQQDYKVIIACRNPEKGNKALSDIKRRSSNDSVELKIVDMSLQESIENLSNELHNEYRRIDIVIHNAANFD